MTQFGLGEGNTWGGEKKQLRVEVVGNLALRWESLLQRLEGGAGQIASRRGKNIGERQGCGQVAIKTAPTAGMTGKLREGDHETYRRSRKKKGIASDTRRTNFDLQRVERERRHLKA